MTPKILINTVIIVRPPFQPIPNKFHNNHTNQGCWDEKCKAFNAEESNSFFAEIGTDSAAKDKVIDKFPFEPVAIEFLHDFFSSFSPQM